MSAHEPVLPALLLLLLAGASLAVGMAAIRMLAFRRRLAARAARLPEGGSPARAGGAPLPLQRLERRTRAGLEELLAEHLDRAGAFRSRLAAAGLAVSLGRFLLLSVAAAFLLTLLLHAAGASGPLLLLAFAAALTGLPALLIWVLFRRRRARFEALLPDAIGLMVRGLRAGVPVSETVGAVARELDEPVASAFRRVHDQARLGLPLETALWQEARLVRVPAFDFLVVSLSIQRETGGNLAETLSGVADLVRQRRQIQLKVRALTSEARASAVILGALPIALAVLMAVMAPEYLQPLFETRGGQLMLTVAAGSLAIGAATMAALVRLER